MKCRRHEVVRAVTPTTARRRVPAGDGGADRVVFLGRTSPKGRVQLVKSLLIVGGGITGLAAAYLAARAGRAVTVLEGGSQPGGLLSSFSVGDTRLEHYYHHFFTHDVELNWLIRELGIESRVRYLPGSMGIYRDGASHAFNGFGDLLRFRPLGLVAKFRFAASSLFLAKCADWRSWEGVSCLKWFEDYAGPAATDAIWRPMLGIKFGPYAERVPAAWMVGRLRQRMNSRRRGGERLGYLAGSLAVLLDRLLEELESLGVRVLVDHRAEALVCRAGRAVAVQTARGSFEADDILATLPADRFADVVAPVAPEYAGRLRAIEHFGAVCTVLEMDRELGPFYWLNVADPGFPFGGVIEHTRLVPPGEYGGRHIVYLSRYFERSHPLATMSQDDIAATMVQALARLSPRLRHEHILKTHVFRTNTAAVVCDLDFSRKVPAMRTPIPGLFYAGMAHVYPDERSCNNSIRVAIAGLRALGCVVPALPRTASLAALIGTETGSEDDGQRPA